MAWVRESSWQRWSSQLFRPKERHEAWQAALNDSHLHWTLEDKTKDKFSAHLEVGRLGDIQVVRCTCDPCRGFRKSHEIALDKAYYGLLLIYQGQEEVACRGQSALLGPGSFLLWDSTAPVSFRLHSPIHKITVLVPQKRMLNALPQADCLVGKAIDWRRGLGAVTASHISALGSQVAYISTPQVQPAAETTLELIATCLEAQHSPAGGRAGADLLKKIKGYIEANLEDPALGPHSLAQRFGISVRYLHLLFEEGEFTVLRWIVERRLERCRRELIRGGRRKNITEVAFHWGFNDPAHFSRVFKKRYGLSPRDYRHSHTISPQP